jgi:zinc/manganese transport system substrate-binding protein
MWKIMLATLVAAPILLATAAPAHSRVNVVGSTPEIAALVREIGGDLVSVLAIAKPLQDPHYVDAKPSFMVHVNRAAVLFYTGLELEIGWLPLLVQGARNPGLVAVELTQGIEVLAKPIGPVSRAEGDVHPLGNPHYWLDPRNGATMAATIAATLKRIDPEHGADYDRNLGAFKATLERKLGEWEGQLAPHKGTRVLDYHTTWLYFANWAGLVIANQIEAKPGIPPAPGHVRTVMAQIGQEKLRLLLQPNFVDPKVGEFLARRTGIRVLSLPATVEGEPGIRTYWDFFDTVVSRVAEALRQPA